MLKVVIAEDEPAVLAELRFAQPWEEWGFVVTGAAEDGPAALDLILKDRPDLVVTDIRMPGMDGLELARRACEALGDGAPAFIVVSGYDDFEYARGALRLGVRNYLLKPVDDDELEQAVSRVASEIGRTRGREKLERVLEEGGAPAVLLFREYELDKREDASSRYVEKAAAAIREAYKREISIEEVAEKLGISAGYLSRVFKKETGYTFVDYLMRFRIKKAVELLKDTELRIYEVADLVGYTDQRYFSQVFRRITGMTPTQFKEGTPGATKPSVQPGNSDDHRALS